MFLDSFATVSQRESLNAFGDRLKQPMLVSPKHRNVLNENINKRKIKKHFC